MLKTLQKRKESNLKRPDIIQVAKFSEHQMDHGGLEHVSITQSGKSRMLQCQSGSQKYLYVVESDKAEKREVSFGTIQGNDIVILRGVEAGEEVVVSGYQNYIEYQIVKLEERN